MESWTDRQGRGWPLSTGRLQPDKSLQQLPLPRVWEANITAHTAILNDLKAWTIHQYCLSL